MLVFNKNNNGNCSCCGITRKHPQKIRHAARDHWGSCLKYSQCKNIITPYNNVLAPSYAQHSKKLVQSQKIRASSNNTTGRWKKVNWNTFLEQRAKQQEQECKEKENNEEKENI